MLEQIQSLLIELKKAIEDLPSQLKVSTKQIVLNTLSDLAKSLGLVTAGEFRVGNGKEPGQGFTGVRMAYPPMSYGGALYPFVAVDNDVLQVGISTTNGKIYGGQGFLTIDENGLNVFGASGEQFVNFYDDDDPTDYVGYIYADRDTSDGTISLCGLSDNASLSGRAGLEGQRASDGKIAVFYVGGTNTYAHFLGQFILLPQTGEEATNSIQFRTSANGVIFNVDTLNERIGIGTGAPQGKLHVVGDVLIGGDSAGYADTIGLTNVTSSPTTGAFSAPTTSVTRGNTGWYKIMVGTTPAYVPYWTDIS